MATATSTATSTITHDPGELARIAAVWRGTALSVAPTDRRAAEAAVLRLYEALRPGERPEIIWCGSPLEAARLVVAEPGRLGAPVRDVLRDAPWRAARAELVDRLGMEQFSRLWRETCAELSTLVSGLTARIGQAVEARAADEQERLALRVALTHALHGQHDAAWLPLFDAADTANADDKADAPDTTDAPGSENPAAKPGPRTPTPTPIHLIAEVARTAGWWWPYEHAVVLTDRPTALHLDEQHRLHQAPGPALAYADGLALYAWHGFTLEPEFAQSLGTLTFASFRDQQNAELRRIMLEYFTVERFLAESDAQPVHEDGTGKLWRIEFPDDEAVVLVEVVNSTPEPDGTFHVYFLRVPPDTRTARAGVAWTFGLTEEEYRPQAQTSRAAATGIRLSTPPAKVS